MKLNKHTYKGAEIVPSTNCANVNAGRRWQIVSYHANGIRYSEVDGYGCRTLAEAKESIDYWVSMRETE